MFENEIKTNVEKSKNTLPEIKDFVKVKNLISDNNIDKNIRQYFLAELNRWIDYEKNYFHNHRNLHLDSVSVKNSLHQLSQIIFDSAFITDEELNLYIESAVILRLNYLCRPLTTINWFLFKGDTSRQITELIPLLDYFTDYAYLTDTARKILEDLLESGESWVTLDDFSAEIRFADKAYIGNLTFEQFTDLFEELFLFFASDSKNEKLIPIEAAIIFLSDKEINQVSSVLENLLNEENRREISKAELIKLFYENT